MKVIITQETIYKTINSQSINENWKKKHTELTAVDSQAADRAKNYKQLK